LHAFSDTNTLQIPASKKKKARRGSAGSVGSVSTNPTTPGSGIGSAGGNGTETMDPDAWMSGEAAGAVVDAVGGKLNGRPLLRSVRKRRSSFSAADVII